MIIKEHLRTKEICPEFRGTLAPWKIQHICHSDAQSGRRWQPGQVIACWPQWAPSHGLAGSRILSNYCYGGPRSRQYSPMIKDLDLGVRSGVKPQMSFHPTLMGCPDVPTNGGCPVFNNYLTHSTNTEDQQCTRHHSKQGKSVSFANDKVQGL